MNDTIEIRFTQSACEYIKKMLVKSQGIGFRLSVKKTGCSGFSYCPEIIPTSVPGDLKIKREGFDVFVDPKWLALLNGLCIDYTEEEKSGLKQKRLTFTNPNEANRCGCGESFHLPITDRA